MLLALAIERATAKQRETLALVGEPALDGEQLVSVQKVLIDTGALRAIEQEVASLTRQALSALEQAPIPDDARDALAALARFVSGRKN
jgi:geranylgeranyl diphosphate synthase type I